MPRYNNDDMLEDILEQHRCKGYEVITSTYKPCTHDNGCYGIVKFLWLKKRVYFCLDCQEFLYGKRLKEISGD